MNHWKSKADMFFEPNDIPQDDKVPELCYGKLRPGQGPELAMPAPDHARAFARTPDTKFRILVCEVCGEMLWMESFVKFSEAERGGHPKKSKE